MLLLIIPVAGAAAGQRRRSARAPRVGASAQPGQGVRFPAFWCRLAALVTAAQHGFSSLKGRLRDHTSLGRWTLEPQEHQHE
jgi:hypothetical protein